VEWSGVEWSGVVWCGGGGGMGWGWVGVQRVCGGVGECHTSQPQHTTSLYITATPHHNYHTSPHHLTSPPHHTTSPHINTTSLPHHITYYHTTTPHHGTVLTISQYFSTVSRSSPISFKPAWMSVRDVSSTQLFKAWGRGEVRRGVERGGERWRGKEREERRGEERRERRGE